MKLYWTPTYSSEEELLRGCRVRVSFSHREYIGIILGKADFLDDIAPEKVLPILETNTGLPPISGQELRLWEFISSYYACTLGEVYKAAYPQMKTNSELVLARKAPEHKGFEGSLKVAAPKPEVLIKAEREAFYLEKIKECLGSGRQTLVLVPETALADTLKKKMKSAFKDSLRTFNSRQTAAQRRETARLLRDGSPIVVLGTRSAIFLPFSKLGLIITDEEQDSSYKQSEPNPRYNGRDTAVVLAGIHGSELILGTSTPSFETLLNISTGKYGTIVTDSVCGEGARNVGIIDLQSEQRKNGVKGPFSIILSRHINECEGRVCLVRGWEKENELKSIVELFFPGRTIDIKTASAAANDSERYDLLGVLQADAFFDGADFRSDEKALHLLTRLSSKAESVFIQTYKADHPVFAILSGRGDIGPMMSERKAFNLPPYSRLMDIVIEDDSPKRLEMFSEIVSGAFPPALKMEEDGKVKLRFTLPKGREAGNFKETALTKLRGIELRYRYNGHIYVDVDPV